MRDLIIEQIERRARVEHGGDVNKAAAEYFRDHPKQWQRYTEEVTGVNKRAGVDREEVSAEVHYRIELVAHRDKLDLDLVLDLRTFLDVGFRRITEHVIEIGITIA
jgi:hypothetical protein